MARGRNEGSIDQWIETLGQQIGVQLGKVIAEHLQRTLDASVDLGAISRRLAGPRGRSGAAGRGACSEAGCGEPVLARGLCRSHYYRARYQSQKGGARRPGPGRRARRAGKNGAASGDATPA